MIIGLPRALLFYRQNVFVQSFFEHIGHTVAVSPVTNKQILKMGLNACVDEACLPVKIFFGHVCWLTDKCDAILIPRLFGKDTKQACPMICGLKEMVKNSFDGLPRIIDEPVLCFDKKKLFKWAMSSLRYTNAGRIKKSFEAAIKKQCNSCTGIKQEGFLYSVALIGHEYNVQDSFVNKNLIKKLNGMGAGVITAECVAQKHIETEVDMLFKRPFWYCTRQHYGSAAHIVKNNLADGMIYISAFSCGVDSVVIELIKGMSSGFPFMVLKIDEHTGEANYDTRIEAFFDMLERRNAVDNNISAFG